jgi:hypothetical protein
MKFTKYDSLKAELDLLPPRAIELIGFVLRHGRLVYEAENWRKCPNHKKYVAAMLRHGFKHLAGESTDSKSGLLHLAHAVCSGLFALELFGQIGEDKSMERKQFSYFAIIERKSKKRGVIVKRFRSYERAWEYLTDQEMDPQRFPIRTVDPKDKIGSQVIC